MLVKNSSFQKQEVEFFNAEKARNDFPILQQKMHNKPLVYLDNSATSQKPRVVIDALTTYFQESNANIHRGVYKLSEQATRAYEQAHEKVARFIGALPEEVIFTKGTTEGLNLLAYSLSQQLKKGDEIVLTQMEHHSNLVPWQQMAKRGGFVVKFIPLTNDFRLDMDAARALITSKTKIVSVTHISNVLGTINPVQDIAALAHKHGALCVVDGAQSIPHIPINVKELDCDFFACSGHKMYGPTGIGFLYGKKELLECMQPFLYGGDMIAEVGFDDSTWNELPWKFEAGTPPIAEGITLGTAVDYVTMLGMEHIKLYEDGVTAYALDALKKIKGLHLYGPESVQQRIGVISFTIEGMHPHDVATLLDREGIAVRGGHHCAMPLMSVLGVAGTTRISLACYNTREEIDKVVEAIKKAQKVFGVC